MTILQVFYPYCLNLFIFEVKMNEKNITYIFYAAVVVVLVYLFSQLFSERERIDDLKQQLDAVKTNQHQLTEQIEAAGVTNSEVTDIITDSGKQVNGIAESNKSITADIEESGRIIDQCQSIIDEIRSRNEKGK